MRRLCWIALLAPAIAHAHVKFQTPAPRTNTATPGPVPAPCGADTARGTQPTTFMAGETIQVTYNEFINHPGHYRFSFDDNGQDFIDPADPNQNQVGIDPMVLADQVPSPGGGVSTIQLTFPNVACTNCTLQAALWKTDTNSYDYACADIILVTPPSPDGAVDAGPSNDAATPGDGGADGTLGDDAGTSALVNPYASQGCSTSSGTPGLVLAPLVLVLRRRRRR